jgi:hypothetical protein
MRFVLMLRAMSFQSYFETLGVAVKPLAGAAIGPFALLSTSVRGNVVMASDIPQ